MDIKYLLNPIRNDRIASSKSHQPPLSLPLQLIRPTLFSIDTSQTNNNSNTIPFILMDHQTSPQTYNNLDSRNNIIQTPYSSTNSPYAHTHLTKRIQLSVKVLEYLKGEFSRNKFPDTQERLQLSELLKVPARSIQSNEFCFIFLITIRLVSE